MICTRHLTKRVKTSDTNLTLLDNINLELAEGQSLAIVGESGSGKTTLLGLLASLDHPTEGDVIFDNQSLFELSEEQRAEFRKQNLGFVFQNFQLLEGLTALENVMLPLELKGDRKAKEKAINMLDKVGLSARLNHFSNQLSGGEQQRVAIARAYVTEPKLMLADEPTGNLDTVTGQKIIDLIFAINKEQNTTMLLVTHDHRLATLCDQQIRLSAGKIIENN
ncbi:MAG: ABC transporter ATP-binding protein [Enterobacterales bacterium]|nr:ABC transporter ATP-binding protein [Enterobacterales bacterium]